MQNTTVSTCCTNFKSFISMEAVTQMYIPYLYLVIATLLATCILNTLKHEPSHIQSVFGRA